MRKTHMGLPKTVPLGRLADLIARPDADLIAIRAGRGLFADFTVRRFRSRDSLVAWCTARGNEAWRALVKDAVAPTHVAWPNVQRGDR